MRRLALGRARLSAVLVAVVAMAGPPALADGSAAKRHAPARAHRPLARAAWVGGVRVTEYFPVPESWFTGRLVAAPGLAGTHRIDWLYSAQGISMEGDGIGLDGRPYHLQALGSGGWIDAQGHPSRAGARGWKGGPPYWRAGAYWRNRAHQPTFPLAVGGWSNGPGLTYVPLPGVSFAPGPSLALTAYHSVAVDPHLIPLGSRVFIPAYRNSRYHGWFVAQDTGGAIIGRHVDVYRTPPPSASDGGDALAGQRIYVIPPGASAGRGAPTASGEYPGAPTAPPVPGATAPGASTAPAPATTPAPDPGATGGARAA